VSIRVVIADDHAIVRSGLEQLLSTADDIALVGISANGMEVVETVQRERPDVVLMDLSMPELDGAEATRRIVAANPEARVVVLTSFGDDRHIADALHAGAVGYVLKHADPDELLDAIRAAARGDSPLDPKAARVLLDSRRIGPGERELSAREEEVLRLGVTDRTQAALWARDHLPPSQ
jgi:DNA-binding NarL/FixJ family response regulator